ncbi:MAG: tetratricopeptide repeat protein [bacterium]
MPQEGLFPTDPETGSIVGGKYRLQNKLSEGGGGVVWSASDQDGREIALKFLKWSPSKSKHELAERFKNEFAILKSLFHPNIAQIYDFGVDAQTGLYFFTSELITAGDFRTMINAPVSALEDLLLQSLRALEYLRSHRLLHLDIKPHNLLLRQAGEKPEVALIDFGLATFRPPDRPGGTPNYMAPELIAMRLGDGGVSFPPPDHRTDLYSLGVTFYHCLTGVQPFHIADSFGRLDQMATLKKHLDFEPPPPSTHRPEIPPYLDRIIMKLMARLPDDRYPSAIVAAQALQYSSSRKHDPESLKTLLAYLPKEGKLIGRRREREAIEQTLRDISALVPHAPPAVCISGTRGVGRTRLLMAAKPLAQQLEMEVTLIREGDPLTAEAIEKILEEDGVRGVHSHLLIIDDLERCLTDDCGACDPAARHALGALVRRMRIQQRLADAPKPHVAFIFTLNSEKADPTRALQELNIDQSVCRSLELRNFTPAEVSEYLTAVLGEEADASVVDQLARCTDGNPRFITEHLEQMISEGRLFSLAGRPDAATLKAIGVDFAKAPPSQSFAEAVMDKLGSLSPEAQRLTLMLACFGRPANAEELRAASGSEGVDKDLLKLVGARLVRRSRRDGRFSFANALSARVIRERASPELRAAGHDAIAVYLKGRRNTKKEELDLHLAYGSHARSKLPALTRLADGAIAANDGFGAAQHIEAMLKLIPKSDWLHRADAIAKLGRAYERAYSEREAKEAYQRLKRLAAPQALRREFRARAEEHMGLIAMRRRDLREARRRFRDAIEEIGDAKGMASWRVRIENRLASVDLRDGHIEEALERFQRSAAVAEKKLSDAERKTITDNELGDALLRAGRVEEAIAILTKELAATQRTGNAERTASRHYLLGNALRHDSIKRYDDALEHYTEGLAIARRHRLIEMQVRLQNGIGNLKLMTGKPKQAMEHYREALKLAQQIEGETTSVELMIGMGLASQKMGDHDRTIEYFEAALDFSRAPKGASAGLIRRYHPTIYVSLADAYFHKRDFTRAEEYLKKARALDHREQLSPDIRYSLYGTYVELYLEQGDRESAEKFMPTIEAIAKSFPPAKDHYSKLVIKMMH